MADIIARLREISTAPQDNEAFNSWLEAQDALDFLIENTQQDEFVLYATPGSTFINTVLVPATNVDSPNVDDLMSWNFNAHSSWGVNYTSEPPAVSVTAPFEDTGTKTFNGGQQLVFPRSFEGRLGDKRYWEVLQPFAHVFGLHFLAERNAYCRLDERGDVEDVIRIVTFPSKGDEKGGTVITFKRDILDQWMLLTDSVILRTFDFTRWRRSHFHGWSGIPESTHRAGDDLFYRFVHEAGLASFTRGCQIVRPVMHKEELIRRHAWPPEEENKQYASFITHDLKNNVIREVSCAPGATANYFTESDLPFEVSPAFFRPDVLLKYKADSDKYTLEDRSISCRSTWHLKTYDINEAGQVHTYICYLRDLPYDEQLHWKAYNEWPKAPISRRAVITDFEGRWHQEYDALCSLKEIVEDLDRRQVPWWALRSDELTKQVHYPVTSSADEWATEILHLQQLLVEGFDHKWLRRKAHSLGRTPDPKLGSLKLIEECLLGLGYEEDDARKMTAPLHLLHYVRSKVKGHVSGDEALEIKKRALSEHGSYRKHFASLTQECDESIRRINEAFKVFN